MTADPGLPRRLSGFGLLLAAVLIAQLDRLHEALPVLGLLRGRLGPGLLTLAALLALARRPGLRLPTAVSDRTLFAIAAAAYLAIGLHYTSRLQATGDEPEYLLMAQSLWRDADLELSNNWEEQQFLAYVPGMPREPYGTFRADGRPFPTRSPGLPTALAPAYALAGRAGCVVLLALAAAAFGVQIRALAALLGGDARAAMLGWLAATGPPALFYSFHAYPAILAGLALATSLRLLLQSRPGPAAAAAAGLAAAALPWLHTRLLPAALALGLVALARLRGRALAAFLGVVAAMAAGFAAYHVSIFGAASPLGPYGGKLPRGVRRAIPLHATGGVLLDRGFGLLTYAPVFVLALGATPDLLRRGRAALPWLAVGLSILLPVIFWRLWFGGFCPPARFLVPAVPVLASLVALRLAVEPERGLARWTPALLALGFAWALLLTAWPSSTWLLNVKEHPPLVWSWLTDPDWAARYLPNYTSLARVDERVAMSWASALVVLLGLDAAARRSRFVDGLFAGPGLALAVMLVTGLVIDTWAY
jgi:hypothetical protein